MLWHTCDVAVVLIGFILTCSFLNDTVSIVTTQLQVLVWRTEWQRFNNKRSVQSRFIAYWTTCLTDLHRYEVFFQNGIDCGGGYVKLLSHSDDLRLVRALLTSRARFAISMPSLRRLDFLFIYLFSDSFRVSLAMPHHTPLCLVQTNVEVYTKCISSSATGTHWRGCMRRNMPGSLRLTWATISLATTLISTLSVSINEGTTLGLKSLSRARVGLRTFNRITQCKTSRRYQQFHCKVVQYD